MYYYIFSKIIPLVKNKNHAEIKSKNTHSAISIVFDITRLCVPNNTDAKYIHGRCGSIIFSHLQVNSKEQFAILSIHM
jgi:hypothetical protein